MLESCQAETLLLSSELWGLKRSKVWDRFVENGRASVVVFATDSERLKTVFVELSEAFAIIGVKGRVLHDFVTKVAWIILEIAGFERGVLLFTTSLSISVLVVFRVSVDDCLRVLYRGHFSAK